MRPPGWLATQTSTTCGLQLGHQPAAGEIVADLADEAGRVADAGGEGGDVRRAPTPAVEHARRRVRVGGDRTAEPDDDVVDQVPQHAQHPASLADAHRPARRSRGRHEAAGVRQDGDMTPDEIDALADRFFAAISAGDVEAVRSCYDPSVAVWHNYEPGEQALDANLAVLGWLGRHVTDLRYDDIRRIVLDDGFVQQHVLRGTADWGLAIEVPAMLRVFVADGRIHRIEEYLDTAQTAELRRGRPSSAAPCSDGCCWDVTTPPGCSAVMARPCRSPAAENGTTSGRSPSTPSEITWSPITPQSW